jgi:poly-gamma-glutamate capsule biosynthesis protein CapA/YwtB (metallophosphatase superfamily)
MGTDNSFRLVVTGDAIINRPLLWVKDPNFERVREIVSGADASFTNLELVCAQLPLTPSSVYQGHNVSAPPETVDELLKLGFNLYSFANNHTGDYGAKGIRDTLALFQGAKAAIAGAGDTLEQARRPRYLETANGRVGLIAATVSNAWLTAAADANAYDVGRPGVNPLRMHTEYFLDQARFDAQEEILKALQIPSATGMPYEKSAMHPYKDRNMHFSIRPKGSLLLESALIQRGDKPEVRQTIMKEDSEAICRWIREARHQSNLVVVSICCHEGANAGWDTGETPQFLIDTAHKFIDAGADVIAGHGPHRLRPIEIYKGRPIFYSLGSFSFIYETYDRYEREIYNHFGLGPNAVPTDMTDLREGNLIGNSNLVLDGAGRRTQDRIYESVVVECEFSGNDLNAVKLHPIVMGAQRPRLEKGYPALASVSVGTLILEELAASGKMFGTTIKIEESSGSVVGSIKLA